MDLVCVFGPSRLPLTLLLKPLWVLSLSIKTSIKINAYNQGYYLIINLKTLWKVDSIEIGRKPLTYLLTSL